MASSFSVAHKARSCSSSGGAGHHHHSSDHTSTGRHIVVQHDYKDHANDTPPVLDNILESLVHATSPNASFPYKLYDMLQRVEQDGHSHIISFQPHGRCLVVHKPELLVDLLPTYFNLSKIPSFQRQLNLYGFRRLTKGPDRGGYYHEFFLRGKPFLIPRIMRLKVKGTGVRARSNPEQEPDFWAMPWVGASSHGIGAGQGMSEMVGTAPISCLSSAPSPVPIPSTASVVSSDDRDVPDMIEISAGTSFASDDDDDDDENDDSLEGSNDGGDETSDDASAVTYSSQCFEFNKPLAYSDDMELEAWGQTFHYMSDIDVDETKPEPHVLPPSLKDGDDHWIECFAQVDESLFSDDNDEEMSEMQ